MTAKIIRFWDHFTRRKPTTPEKNRYSIDDGWRDHFAPAARRAGFKGSGRHFRRVVGEFVQTINLQGSRWSGRFAINLGLQPLTIPDVMGKPVDPKTIKEIDCIFRRRLSNDDDADKWWDYTEERSSIEAAVKSAAHLFENRGLDLFDALSGSASPILHLKAADLASETSSFLGFRVSVPLTALALARFRKARGDLEEAAAFARIGLERSTPQFGHRRELEAIASLASEAPKFG